MQKAKRIILKNGMRLVLVPQKESLATTVFVAVEAGSKYETKEVNGISHFLEHMCFKGTTKRPRPIDIVSELDGLGAQYNAFTGQELTSYYAKVKSGNAEKIIDVIADMYMNPVFDPNEIEREKGVIIQEINMYEDTPARRVSELFMSLVYGDQPAGWDVAGRKEVIEKITRDDFISYRRKHYVPQATIAVVAGAFNPGEMTKKIEAYFSVLPAGKKGGKPKTIESQKKPRELVHYKKSDQTHLILGFRAFSMRDKRRYALEVLSEVLGGGMSSRFFQTIREELGAAYYVGASADLLSDHGLFTMFAGADHGKIEQVIRTALREFKRTTEELIGPKELNMAKEHLLGNLFLSLETSDQLAYYYGMQEAMREKLMTPREVASEIKSVTPAQIRAVARALVRNDRLNLAVIGPFKSRSFLDIVKV